MDHSKTVDLRGDARNPPVWGRDEKWEVFKKRCERWMKTQDDPNRSILLILQSSFRLYPSVERKIESIDETSLEIDRKPDSRFVKPGDATEMTAYMGLVKTWYKSVTDGLKVL